MFKSEPPHLRTAHGLSLALRTAFRLTTKHFFGQKYAISVTHIHHHCCKRNLF